MIIQFFRGLVSLVVVLAGIAAGYACYLRSQAGDNPSSSSFGIIAVILLIVGLNSVNKAGRAKK